MHLFRANRLKPTFLELNSLNLFFHTYIVNKETTNYLTCSSPTRDNPDFKNAMSLGGVICFNVMGSRLRKESSFLFSCLNLF